MYPLLVQPAQAVRDELHHIELYRKPEDGQDVPVVEGDTAAVQELQALELGGRGYYQHSVPIIQQKDGFEVQLLDSV